MLCFFVSDLHGQSDRYNTLFQRMILESPDAVFWGGDLLPSPLAGLMTGTTASPDFIHEILAPELHRVKHILGDSAPRQFLILGNDDGRFEEDALQTLADDGLCEYVHNRRVRIKEYDVYGYAYIPPTPFLLKDWERYDVSRFVDPGSIAPSEGRMSRTVDPDELEFATIQDDLRALADGMIPERSIFLFHAPPYNTKLDRAALDGQMVDHVPLDVHIGSIAIQRFIQRHQPLLTLHGHVHESALITGTWRDRLGVTHMFNAAHHGPELSVIRFDPSDLDHAERELIPV